MLAPHESAAARPLERRAESELQHPRLIHKAEQRNRLAVIRVALAHLVVAEVFVIEHVVGLQNPIERYPPVDPEPLLESQIDTVQRIADKVVPRHDRPVRTQAITSLAAQAQVTAVGCVVSLPGAVEVQPTHLEAA